MRANEPVLTELFFFKSVPRIKSYSENFVEKIKKVSDTKTFFTEEVIDIIPEKKDLRASVHLDGHNHKRSVQSELKLVKKLLRKVRLKISFKIRFEPVCWAEIDVNNFEHGKFQEPIITTNILRWPRPLTRNVWNFQDLDVPTQTPPTVLEYHRIIEI